jgi:aminodeoxyfutalosine deaminase
MMDSTSHLLRARWVFPVSGPPIEDGVIAIEDGAITRLDSGGEPEALDLGRAAIIPGLVNCHTHLEFSGLLRPLPPAAPFADWIRSVIEFRRNTAEDVGGAIRQGLDEIRLAGTTLVGEIATSSASQAAVDEADVDTTLFLEVLGLDDAALTRQTAAVTRHFAACQGGRVQAGLSPHAPYSVHPELLRWAIDTARDLSVPVAMHLAETREELELLARGTGPLVDLLRSLGVWREGVIARGATIGDYLAQLSGAPRVLVIHGNYLTDAQIEFIAAQPHFSVIYCPRTHAYFGHDPHPWRKLLERGINVALGTDSRASNPDLNLWNEVLFLRQQFSDVPAATLLQMATLNGAVALGRSQTEENASAPSFPKGVVPKGGRVRSEADGPAIAGPGPLPPQGQASVGQTWPPRGGVLMPLSGTLQVGRAADLAVVALPQDVPSTSPEDLLLHPASRVVRTMSRGRWA